MRVAICEDDTRMQQKLSEAIAEWAAARKTPVDILCYPNAEAFVMVWPELSFDLSFLDIQMKKGGMSGIELAQLVRKTDRVMQIVFVTSFSQYVLKGYDVNALHYLIKPLSQAKLLPVLDKALTIWKSQHNAALLVADEAGQRKLLFDEIYYITLTSHAASVQTEDCAYELRKTAEELSVLLPVYFIRCHRSYIANLYKVDCAYKHLLLMSNGKTLPVSRKKSKGVSDAFVRLHK
ncbi:MAG: LytTR family DNA-binding domain-containing protein [Lachnospiraceae bacterium]|jgi:DNA-binding LytR/AlgR family response regulator|nr:LytTR family DNA-binding domain-containing protein [Lachnospiraceae bacterium]